MGTTFVINYEVLLKDGTAIKDKEIKVKNKISELQAKISLEDYLKTKYQNFELLIITDCHEESFFGDTTNLFGEITDFFGGFNRKK